MKLSHCFANKVYDILVANAGAHENNRDCFVYSHCDDEGSSGTWIKTDMMLNWTDIAWFKKV